MHLLGATIGLFDELFGAQCTTKKHSCITNLFYFFAPSLVCSTFLRPHLSIRPQGLEDEEAYATACSLGRNKTMTVLDASCSAYMNEPFSLINSTISVQVVVPHNGLMSLECLQTL